MFRNLLYGWAFHKGRREAGEPDGELAEALQWIRVNSLGVTVLDEKERRSELIRGALDALTRCMDGSPAAATTVARKRAVFHGALSYAVELDMLPSNPIDKVTWKAPKVAEEIDRSVVPSPKQVASIIDEVGVERPELKAFFGSLYYCFMRPGESKMVHKDDLTLPADGWGGILLSESAPRVGAAWTDNGTSHDLRQLKHRPRKAVRYVPVPPIQVRLFREHLELPGAVAPDGRLFVGQRGAPLSESVYGRVYAEARKRALTPAQVRSLLAARPYDLRHGGVTLALNAGVPAPEVARRAGQSVEVLLRIYAGCIDGHEQLWNGRIDDALTDEDDDS